MSGKDAVCGSQSRQDLTKIKECIREDIIRCMNRERVVSDEEIKDMIQQRVLDLGHEMYFSVTQKQEMIQGIFNSLRKLDILQEILEQDDVTEIMVNGYQTIFIEKAGRLYRYPHSFSSQSKLEDVIQQIVSRMNRVVNEASPIVDVRLEDGSRVNVVLPPVAIGGRIPKKSCYSRIQHIYKWRYRQRKDYILKCTVMLHSGDGTFDHRRGFCGAADTGNCQFSQTGSQGG